jgi:hypothetical protein
MIIEVIPDKFELPGLELKLEDYASRQVWTRAGT